MIVVNSATFEDPLKLELRGSLLGKPISCREYEILQMLCAGKFNYEIAATLGISVKTISEYFSRIKEKTGARNSVELTLMAIKQGLIKCEVSTT